jgi:hypothetical protein
MVGGTGDGLLPKIYKAHDKNGHQDAHQGQERAQLRTLQHRLVPGQEHGLRARGRGGGYLQHCECEQLRHIARA